MGLSTLNFVNGDDNPYWSWDITVQPGETVTLMTFAVGEATKAAAATTAAQLAVLAPALGPLRCMDAATVNSVANFSLQRFLPITPFRAADTRSGSGGRLAAGR